MTTISKIANPKRVSHCSHWGSYTLLVDDGRIVGVEPFDQDPNPSPIIQNVTGWADPSKRVLKPMVRREWLEKRGHLDGGGRGRDTFVEVSWETAFDLVASEINRVRHEHGNASIFAGSYGWTSCGRFHHASSQLKRMLNLVGGFTGHVDTYSIAAGPVILRHVLGDSAACDGGANTLDTIAEHTDTLVVFGALSPRTAQNEAGGLARHQLEDYLKQMRDRGMRIVLVSPLRDDLPDWLPAEWWPIRPNTDTALMLALAGEIVAAGLEDRSFLETHCSGAETFLDYLKGTSDGIPKNASWAEDITGLPANDIRALARQLVETRSMVTVSWALQRAEHGEQPFWAALGLAATIGQIGLPGGGVGYGYGSLGGVGAPQTLSRSPSFSQGKKPIQSFIPVARISDMLLNPGKPFEYEGETYAYPDIRLVYWAGGNPFHHHQDINRLRRAWERPETIIVQDPVWTATAARADIVLPATTSLERNDISGNKRSDMIIAMQQAIAPLGDSRSDFDICRGIAERLGVGEAFTEGRDEMGWVEHLYEQCRTDMRDRLGHEAPDFATFWRQGYVKVPTRNNVTYLAEFRADPTANPINTESGRIVLTSEKLTALGYDDCRAHPAWIEPSEWLGSRAASSETPFHLISHQPPGKLHSQLDGEALSALSKRNGREMARINSADASRLGIEHGHGIRLWNERGQVIAIAKVDDNVRSGVIVLPTGAWYAPLDHSDNALELAGNPNVLTLDKGTSRFGQGCSAHTCLVAVESFNDHNLPQPTATGAPPEAVISVI
ncbi:MAG: molybdopterin-dependent oxidoreductase [Rhizobiaceae bacterium]